MQRAVIIQRGESKTTYFSLNQALSLGLDVTLIGDSEQRRLTGARFIDISYFKDLLRDLETKYKHRSINPDWFEFFCFARWFLILELMKKEGGPWITFDTDVLVYGGIDEWFQNYPSFKMCNTAWINFIRCPDVLEDLCDYFLKIWKDGPPDDVPKDVVSDMNCLYSFARCRSDVFALQGQKTSSYLGLDHNFNCPDEFEPHISLGEKRYKLMDRGGRSFYGRRDDGQHIQFHALHFQGGAKFLMPAYASELSESAFLEAPVMSPPHDAEGASLLGERSIYIKSPQYRQELQAYIDFARDDRPSLCELSSRNFIKSYLILAWQRQRKIDSVQARKILDMFGNQRSDDAVAINLLVSVLAGDEKNCIKNCGIVATMPWAYSNYTVFIAAHEFKRIGIVDKALSLSELLYQRQPELVDNLIVLSHIYSESGQIDLAIEFMIKAWRASFRNFSLARQALELMANDQSAAQKFDFFVSDLKTFFPDQIEVAAGLAKLSRL